MSSEIALLRRQIAEEYVAGQRALTDFALTSRHAFITARLENIARHHEALQTLVGEERAMAIVVDVLENLQI